jgi:serine/threonine protein kinase/tetratricopeptide (TPR) repeat protein
MGVVYVAHDDRLDRPVAVKLIRDLPDDVGRRRFWREARLAARVTHPNVCQVYELGEHGGIPFIAMELLAGESLASRLKGGPLPFNEALEVGLSVLAALHALHSEGIIHRDLKPANIFLATYGVKLLDFGLARAGDARLQALDLTATQITQAGVIAGTPGYMSPEQLLGESVDARSDLFAAGAVLFEMLSGKCAFTGTTPVDVLHAIIHEPPPALGGSAAIEAVSRVVRRSLAKNPDGRYQTASVMASDLRAVPEEQAEAAPQVRRLSWLMVLPFRTLRSDPDTDFLAFSLPDAITSSLAGLETLGMRSSSAAAKFGGDPLDLNRIASEAHVDILLTGTILRVREEIRVNTQLTRVPDGTLLWAHTSCAALERIFELQDELVQRVVSSAALPLTSRDHRTLRHDVAANASAYEFYLRGNQMSHLAGLWSIDRLAIARDLYLRSLDEDPLYAPAWARLGKCHRVIAKSGENTDANLARAESCLKKALELSPDLAIAHTVYAQLEADLGRAQDALLRLVARACLNTSDPEVFVGLVHACRYCGLLAASVAAHDHARQLDPQAVTSVSHTFWFLGDYAQALREGGDFYIKSMLLAAIGRTEEALALLRDDERWTRPEPMRELLRSLRTLLEGRREESLESTRRCIAHFRDPEALFYMARHLAFLGEIQSAFDELRRVVERGYLCSRMLVNDSWLDRVRSIAEFEALVEKTVDLERHAAAAFVRAGGDRVLGVTSSLTPLR